LWPQLEREVGALGGPAQAASASDAT
jgi:hypothetical protein